MDFILNWVLRGVYISIGVGAAIWIYRWMRANWRTASERWTVRIAAGMILMSVVYTAAHARLLVQRSQIEAGRERYAVYGDPRRTELRRGEVRGWILDCTEEQDQALALYRSLESGVERVYPLGQAGANFLGGGEDGAERDYTIETLFSEELRRPESFLERGELHAAGRDLELTLCRDVTAQAYRGLAQSSRPGAVIVQDVNTGAVLAYAATGGPEDPPLGIKRYSPPGSVFKLALAAVWWENDMPDDIPIECPAEIRVTSRSVISNYGRVAHGTVIGPTGMLIPSCNTAAIWMALHMKEEIGAAPFVEAYERYGFLPYEETPATDSIGDFWRTNSEAWEQRMTPSPSRIRISENTGAAEWAQLSIGQGPVDVTVMGVSRFIHAIANDGVMLPPTIETDLARDPPSGERVMDEETARKLQQAMRLVVERGTGTAVLPSLRGSGWTMGGKTGTAEVADRPDNGWFAGILFDAEGEPRYTIVSFLEGGGPGGAMPATIAGAVARELIDNPPTIRDE